MSRIQGTNKPTGEVTTEIRFYLLSGIRGCGLGGVQISTPKPYRVDPRELGWCSGPISTPVTVDRPSEQIEYNLKDGGNTTGYG